MGWKIYLPLAAALAVIGGTGAFFYIRCDTVIAGHKRDIDQVLSTGIPFRQSTRPAVLGPEEPGNVWDLLRPAAETLWNLHPVYSPHVGSTMDPDFHARGTPAGTPELLAAATPALEDCRRSVRRTVLDWPGPRDPDLPLKMGRVCRALCSMGYVAWQEKRDADAMEWFLTALSVANDTARLGQYGTWDVLEVTEKWVLEDAKDFLSEQGLTAGQLVDVERRLTRLLVQRTPPAVRYRTIGAELRASFLQVRYGELGYNPGDWSSGYNAQVGWRDLFLTRVFVARVCNGIRDGCEEAGRMTWTSGTDPLLQWIALTSRYRAEDVAKLLPTYEIGPLVRLEYFRLAVGRARFLAATGRLPKTLEEAGLTPDLGGHPVTDELSRWPLGRR